MANVQGFLPHQRCQHKKLLLLLEYPRNAIHSPSNAGALTFRGLTKSNKITLARPLTTAGPELGNCRRPRIPATPKVSAPKAPAALVVGMQPHPQPHKRWRSLFLQPHKVQYNLSASATDYSRSPAQQLRTSRDSCHTKGASTKSSCCSWSIHATPSTAPQTLALSLSPASQSPIQSLCLGH